MPNVEAPGANADADAADDRPGSPSDVGAVSQGDPKAAEQPSIHSVPSLASVVQDHIDAGGDAALGLPGAKDGAYGGLSDLHFVKTGQTYLPPSMGLSGKGAGVSEVGARMVLDGAALTNLEVLANAQDGTPQVGNRNQFHAHASNQIRGFTITI